ncbi:LexA family transcriptional regulator [Caldisericum exile]|uniref:HTH dtxR-type domain-containing protein n=1 Tax=Caldisericum exile (strain DSM 21853 / NBRC 104410 / AZM16c01) TaxID=511051 RepID=A0A7U6GFR7_CALEA|nr:hypothetical protein [Caldisericum exile]BAL81586.1 hypothetical protein CSE_14600 [Caldisericum exile AZM16c01]
MISAKITRRQLQFLEAVVKLYKETGLPVSYKDIASRLGVSRWTSYDILQELYKKGFLSVKYRPVGGPGRSEILYEPTEDAIERVESANLFAPITTMGKWFVEIQKKIEKLSVDSAINFVYDHIKNEQNSLIVLLYTLALTIILTKVFNVELREMVNLKAIFNSNTYAPAVLMFFVESIYGILEKNKDSEKIKLDLSEFNKLEEIVRKFRDSSSQVSPSFQDRILKLLSALI